MSLDFEFDTPGTLNLGSNFAMLNGAVGATFSYMCGPESSPAAAMQILYLSINGSNNSRFETQFQATTRRMQAIARAPDGAAAVNVLSTSAVPIDGFSAPNRHVAVVCNTATNQVLFYLDGVIDGTLGVVFGGAFSNLNTGTLNQIGGGGFPTQQLDGTLGDLRVYNRALSAAEIACIAAMRGHDGIVDGLVLRYLMGEQPASGAAVALGQVKDVSPAQVVPTPTAILGVAPTYRDNFMAFRRKVM